MVLTGTYEHTVDNKHRLAIPAELRAQVARGQGQDTQASDGSIRLYITPGDEGALFLYTPDAFEKRAQELDNMEVDDALIDYETFFYAESRLVELDKQGRIRLPEQLLKNVELGNEVVLIGAKDHLEIRNREAWQEARARMLKQMAGRKMNPRRAFQQRKATDGQAS